MNTNKSKALLALVTALCMALLIALPGLSATACAQQSHEVTLHHGDGSLLVRVQVPDGMSLAEAFAQDAALFQPLSSLQLGACEGRAFRHWHINGGNAQVAYGLSQPIYGSLSLRALYEAPPAEEPQPEAPKADLQPAASNQEQAVDAEPCQAPGEDEPAAQPVEAPAADAEQADEPVADVEEQPASLDDEAAQTLPVEEQDMPAEPGDPDAAPADNPEGQETLPPADGADDADAPVADPEEGQAQPPLDEDQANPLEQLPGQQPETPSTADSSPEAEPVALQPEDPQPSDEPAADQLPADEEVPGDEATADQPPADEETPQDEDMPGDEEDPEDEALADQPPADEAAPGDEEAPEGEEATEDDTLDEDHAAEATGVVVPAGDLAIGSTQLNLYAQPSLEAELLQQLEPATLVKVLSSDGEWAHIALADGSQGYLPLVYLVIEQPSYSLDDLEIRIWYLDEPESVVDGDVLTMQGMLIGFDQPDLDYYTIWQYALMDENRKVVGPWTDIDGADGLAYTFTVNAQNAHYSWRLTAVVTLPDAADQSP